MEEDGHLGPVTYQPVEVSLDEAADLANDLIGGPLVSLRVISARQDRLGYRHCKRGLGVRAFIDAECWEAVEEARLLLLEDLDRYCSPRLWRLRDGALHDAATP